MTDISEKSGSLNSDKISIETRVSMHKYHQDAGDGPQMSYPLCDGNQSLLIDQVNSEDRGIGAPEHIAESDNKSLNEIDQTSIPENHKTRLSQMKSEDDNGRRRRSMRDGGANKTFSLSSMNNVAVLEVFKDIQTSINQLKLSNTTVKDQISTDLEQIGSYMLTCVYNQKMKSNMTTKCNINDAEIQRLQMLLLYILQQLNHLNGTITDTQAHIEKLLLLNYKMDSKQNETEEEDIFSVEELSWDEHQLSIQRLEQTTFSNKNVVRRKKLSRQNKKQLSQMKTSSDCQVQLICTSKVDDIANNPDEIIDEESAKAHNSKPFTPQLTDSIIIEKFINNDSEKSTSFQQIKSKFEQLKFSPTASEKKDASVSSSLKCEKESGSIKRSSGNLQKSIISKNDQEILSKKHEEDCVDNSAFLVSSIDSFTESISFTNPNNNNNRFSDKYKTNLSKIIDPKQTQPSVDIDLVAERLTQQPKSSHNSQHIDENSNNAKVDHYIEVVNNVNTSNEALYIDSPYVNYRNENGNESKSSSNSSSEHIVAMGRLVTRFQKVMQKEKDLNKEYSPLYHYMKELVDTEKNYVNGLYIYTQFLYNRIKLSNIISNRNLNTMFPGCIHQIYKFHVDFCDQLNNVFQKTLSLELLKNSDQQKYEENKSHTVKFGQIFLENLENDNWKFFSLYRQFYWKSQSAIAMFHKLKKSSPKFERLIKILQHNEHCNSLEMGSFIQLPSQRLPAYLSMFRRILDKLNSSELDEKIPMLAIEHLLHCFIKEMSSKQNYYGLKKSQCKPNDSSPESTTNSLRCHSFDEVLHQETNSKSQGHEEKKETSSTNIIPGSMKKFWSQAALINDVTKDYSPNPNSETHGSISAEVQLNKFILHSSNAFDRANLSYSKENPLPQKEKRLKHCKLDISEMMQSKDSKSVKEYKSGFKVPKHSPKIPSVDHEKLRPQSVPLQQKCQKIKKSPLFHTSQFDMESLRTTDECSVCLNSQDEFEIDTSIEDEKTCTAESILKNTGKNSSNKSLPQDSSLSPPNSTNCQLIEFCADYNNKLNNLSSNIVEGNKRNSTKWLLSDQNKFSILNNLLLTESDSLINKKVENIVLILCNILVETIQLENQCSKYSMKLLDHRRNDLLPNPFKHPQMKENVMENKNMKSSTDFSNCIEERKENKKFSIKQLFSLRRKSRIEKTYQTDYCDKQGTHKKCDKRSNSRASLQK